MELVPASVAPPSRSGRGRRIARWALAIVTLLVVAGSWRALLELFVIAAVASFLLFVVVVFYVFRRALRPIGELSVVDVALLGSLYRWWTRRRS